MAAHRGYAGVAGGWSRSLIAWLALTRTLVHWPLVRELLVHVATLSRHMHWRDRGYLSRQGKWRDQTGYSLQIKTNTG